MGLTSRTRQPPAAHGPESMAAPPQPPCRNRASGLRKRKQAGRGQPGRAQAPERQPCSIGLPTVKPPSVLDPCGSRATSKPISAQGSA
jgi:hypothetical protein